MVYAGNKKGQATLFWHLDWICGPAPVSGHRPRALGGGCFHVINRGRGRVVVFDAVADRPALERRPVDCIVGTDFMKSR